MRPKTRMKPFLKKLQEYWEIVPDWRFGQLMFNFLNSQATDCFFWEEDEFLDKIDKYFCPKTNTTNTENTTKTTESLDYKEHNKKVIQQKMEFLQKELDNL